MYDYPRDGQSQSINQVYECYWLDKGLRYRAAGWHVKLIRINKRHTQRSSASYLRTSKIFLQPFLWIGIDDLCNLKSNINSICYVNFWISFCFLYIFSISTSYTQYNQDHFLKSLCSLSMMILTNLELKSQNGYICWSLHMLQLIDHRS